MAAAEVVAVAAAGMRPGFGLRRRVGVLRDVNTTTTTSTAATTMAVTSMKTTETLPALSTARDRKKDASWQMPRGCPSCRERQQADGGDAPILRELSAVHSIQIITILISFLCLFSAYFLLLSGLVPVFFSFLVLFSLLPIFTSHTKFAANHLLPFPRENRISLWSPLSTEMRMEAENKTGPTK
jgi:hypothetical protein